MKTTIPLFALILGCIIPTFSQINHNRKADTTIQDFSFSPKKKNGYLGNYKFADKFTGSLNNSVSDALALSTIGSVPGKITEETFSGYNMPCYQPMGIFSMRIYEPDSTVKYNILLKKF